MPDELEVTAHRRGDTSRVDVAGDLTAFTCRRLSDAVLAELRAGALTIELDLAELTFIDSSGVQCLVQARKAADDHDHGRLRVTHLSVQVRRVLEVTGLLGPLTGDEPI